MIFAFVRTFDRSSTVLGANETFEASWRAVSAISRMTRHIRPKHYVTGDESLLDTLSEGATTKPGIGIERKHEASVMYLQHPDLCFLIAQSSCCH